MILNRIAVLRELMQHPLSRGARARTLFNYVRWNLARTMIDRKVVLPLPNGLQLIVPNRSNFATGVYLHQLYDFQNMTFFCHFLRKEDLLLDIGANVGIYGLLAARSTGCHVIACEPAPDTFRTLADNVHLNRLDDLIDLRNAAIGNSEEPLLLSIGQHGLNHVVDDHGTSVPQERLDDVIGDRMPIALKLDVEGYEMHVLRGAKRVLDNPDCRVIMVEINGLIERYGETVDGIRTLLSGHGFSPTAYDPATRALSPGTKLDEVFIRDASFVENRLRTASPIALFDRAY